MGVGLDPPPPSEYASAGEFKLLCMVMLCVCVCDAARGGDSESAETDSAAGRRSGHGADATGRGHHQTRKHRKRAQQSKQHRTCAQLPRCTVRALLTLPDNFVPAPKFLLVRTEKSYFAFLFAGIDYLLLFVQTMHVVCGCAVMWGNRDWAVKFRVRVRISVRFRNRHKSSCLSQSWLLPSSFVGHTSVAQSLCRR